MSRPLTEQECSENCPETYTRAAWQSAVIRWLWLTQPPNRLVDILTAYMAGDQRAIVVFELADKRRRQENPRANRMPDTWKRLKRPTTRSTHTPSG